MKKRMVKSFLLWFFLFLLLLAVLFFTDSIYGFCGILIWILLPVLTWGMNYFVQKGVSFKLQVAPVAAKAEKIKGELSVKNTSAFASGKVICQMEISNELTGEKQTEILEIPLKAKGRTQAEIVLTSLHCGYLCIRQKKVWLMDCFGFLPMHVPVEEEQKISILPDTFQMHIEMQLPAVWADEAEVWSQEYKGDDETEVFSLRDYVSGDELRKIHFKLSSKRQTLVVKEASLPVEKSLLIFWDKNTMDATADEMDAMAEAVASFSQAVYAKGIVYTLGWTVGNTCKFVDIDSEDAWIQAMPQMVKSGANTTDMTFGTERIGEQGRFAKVVCFAKQRPKDNLFLCEMNPVYILCSEETSDDTVATFSAQTYWKDLEAIAL